MPIPASGWAAIIRRPAFHVINRACSASLSAKFGLRKRRQGEDGDNTRSGIIAAVMTAKLRSGFLERMTRNKNAAAIPINPPRDEAKVVPKSRAASDPAQRARSHFGRWLKI